MTTINLTFSENVETKSKYCPKIAETVEAILRILEIEPTLVRQICIYHVLEEYLEELRRNAAQGEGK